MPCFCYLFRNFCNMKTYGYISLDDDKSAISFDTKNDPHGWIQFKGTDLCMDVYCKCGYHSHIDDVFVYFYKCPKCKTIFELNGHVQLIERPDMAGDSDDLIKTGR